MTREPGKIKIVSGGQTGVDRLALDVAIELDIPHSGWCPRGRIAEDGFIPGKYCLRETESKKYSVRTERNISESDGTLVLFSGLARGGTALTIRLAAKHSKPIRTIDFSKPIEIEQLVDETQSWLEDNEIRVLNIAGPRKSSAPELAATIRPFLERLLLTVLV